MVRSMLSTKKIPKTFWPEAINWTIHVLNRSPTLAVKDQTPKEAWSGTKPSVEYICIFGCISHVHVSDSKRTKLDDKSMSCVLLGDHKCENGGVCDLEWGDQENDVPEPDERDNIGESEVVTNIEKCTSDVSTSVDLPAFKNKAAFDRMVDEDKLYDSYFQEDENGKRRVGPPLSDDWKNVRRLVQFLKIFYDATLAFSSYKNVTSSHCFNDICTIEANLNVFTSSRDVNMSNMAFEMKKKFDKYWEGLEINKLLIISSVLDPRSKMGFVTICFEKLYGKDTPKCIEMKEAVMEVLRKLYEVYNAFEMELLDVGVNVGDVQPVQKKFSMYSDMVCEKGDVDETSNELDIYLMEKIEKRTLNRLVNLFQILEETEFMDLLAEVRYSWSLETGVLNCWLPSVDELTRGRQGDRKGRATAAFGGEVVDEAS
nr:zinc finger BED domain-containing protein RICESLEEPER 2-like [Ipomoea batatas]